MDYDLSRLDPRNFEHLIQALALEIIGPGLTVFGDGPDGGREATWDGSAPALDGEAEWVGYGVLQAKRKLDSKIPPSDAYEWLKTQIDSEVKAWKESRAPRRSPQFYVLATNVKLGPGQDHGRDRVQGYVKEAFAAIGVLLDGVKVWALDDIRALIEANESIRTTYNAWILPGDVTAALYANVTAQERGMRAGLHLHAANSLTRDVQLKLNQTGTVRDQPIGVAQVFLDLPHSEQLFSDRPDEGLAEYIIRNADAMNDGEVGSREQKTVPTQRIAVVGGPGQGKSTVTQFLAQVYRTSFLQGTPLEDEPDVFTEMESIHIRCAEIGLPLPAARRWPIRIILPELADALSSKRSNSILEHIASEIARLGNFQPSLQDLTQWLTTHPWLMMLDGLDEVPLSANRGEVMSALDDFYKLAFTCGADIFTVATTRPQGYDNEFGKVKHIELQPLSQDEALSFADTFLDVRNGPTSAQAERTKGLLRIAVQQPATERLFESPLQATILAILIERFGHAPSDRWKLFSAYYQVISQREQEKTGHLAQLLQKYTNEVDYLHRRVGQILQTRGQDAGGAQGQMQKEELQDLIEARLIALGHGSEQAQKLAKEFMRLATERLVFLAILTAETVGFEIRSMQEFMAAEEIIVDHSDSEAFARIREIAPTAYWSNVVRFAAGRIYGSREILKPIILQVCQELEIGSGAASLAGSGRILALDVLSDGVVDTQPIYAVPLGEFATRLFAGPLTRRIADLARVTSDEANSVIEEAAREAAHGHPFAAVAAAVYSANRVRINRSFEPTPSRIFEFQGEAAQLAILKSAWLSEDEDLEPIGRAYCERFDPAELTSDGIKGPFLVRADEDIHDTWDALQAITGLGRTMNNTNTRITTSEGAVIGSVDYTPLQSNTAAWAKIGAVPTAGATWDFLRAVSVLVESGDSDQLANALDASRLVDRRFLGRVVLPWPLRAALQSKNSRAALEASKTSHESSNEAARIREGFLGSRSEWLTRETAFNQLTTISIEDLDNSDPARSTAETPIPLGGLRLNVSGSHARGRRPAAVEAAVSLIKSAIEAPTPSRLILMRHALFVLSMHRRQVPAPTEAVSITRVLEDSLATLAASVPLALSGNRGRVWLDWLSAVDESLCIRAIPVETLDQIGSSSRPIIGRNPALSSLLVQQCSFVGPSWQRVHLAAVLDPGQLPTLAVHADSIQDGSPEARSIGAILRVCAASSAELDQTSADADLETLRDAELQQIEIESFNILAEFVQLTADRAVGDAICARVVDVVGFTIPRVTRLFASILETNARGVSPEYIV